ncbi:MAG TPA: outer membrane beta-barrel protein [Chitinophaga sp.]|uniref:outer membrane beta-barrel protein n=1 Tax=Chitinophaga sp. TaxID=1869181 RepID=UPI002BE8986A|nr:outer membrane beta-barrel protein [Chitinophaga sp.]HVI45622.1 outer membrane beta-barrel protein [Chitinophaga sp.]
MKQIFFLMIFLSATFAVMAQERTFTFGVRAGVQLPQLNGRDKDSVGFSNNVGFIAGMTAVSPVSTHFSLKHDVWLAVNKNQASVEIFPVSPAFYYKGLELFAGPYASLLLHGNNYGAANEQNAYAAKNDLGITIGAGYTFGKRMNVEARYVRGFIPVVEDAGKQQQWKAFRQYLGITVGYNF